MNAIKALSSSYIVACMMFIFLSLFVEGENPLSVFWDVYDFPPIYCVWLLAMAILTLLLPNQD